MRLLIGIPTGGSPAAPFLDSLAAMQLPDNTTTVDRITVTGNFVPGQRELILRHALASGADLLAMIDDDIVLPVDALAQLAGVLDAQPTCALAGALYYSRDGLRPMTVSGWNDQETTTARTPAFDDRTPVAVDGIGFGCVLIRAEALRALEQPFISTQVYLEERANRVRICNEDYLFCGRLRHAGYTVVLHPGVRCGHYDRASMRVFPERWEPPEVTSVDRMTVLRADGSLALVPFDATVAPKHERHLHARLDYIFSGDLD